MKKYIFVYVLVVIAAACGSGKDKAADEQPEKKETNDLSSNPDYQKGLALISNANNLCLTCHKIDEMLTGPSYRDVANKYENTPANVKMLAEKIMKGGSGVWGEILMPANASVSQADAEAIVKYILLLKK